jgi:transcriptional regulator with XRE-family HTH domain
MGSAKALQTRRYRAFRERLRQARLDAGLSQVEVAAIIDKPQTYVSKCELGERRVDFVELEDWAAACRKPLSFFTTRAKG